jgi:hypothetical protein
MSLHAAVADDSCSDQSKKAITAQILFESSYNHVQDVTSLFTEIKVFKKRFEHLIF